MKNLKEYMKENRKKQLAILVDPDKCDDLSLQMMAIDAEKNNIDFIFVGGSIVFSSIDHTIQVIKTNCSIPVLIFPGNVMQISEHADGILFLSLISGRNPEFLIGHHVMAAPVLKACGLEVIPTGYILIENGKRTSVEYMSNTNTIPADKPELAVATAMAGEMLGLQMIYLEAGSGASQTVGLNMIRAVRQNISIPLIVGGGIKNSTDTEAIYKAGADIIVIGTALEEDPDKLNLIAGSRFLI